MEAIPIVVVLTVLAKLAQQAASAETAWRAAAKELGLTYDSGSILGNRRRIFGIVDGIAVVVDATSTRTGNTTSTNTRLDATLPRALGLGLDLRPEGMLATISKLFGTQDILVGDPGFDSSVMVQAADARRVSAWLTPPRRRAIGQFVQANSGGRVSDAGVSVAIRGVVRDAAVLVRTVREIVELCKLLQTSDTEGDTATTGASRKKREKSRDTGAASTGSKPGHGSTATPTSPTAAAEASRADPLNVDGRDVATKTSTRAPAAITPEDLADAVFGGRATSEESIARFDASFKQRVVRWTGVLRWMDGAASDPALGFDVMTRTIVEVCPARPGRAGGKPIQALVKLPTDAAKNLAAQVGSVIEFEGRLTGLDAFAGNIYVEEARVISPHVA